jgi:LPS sulfotransferase NodH
MSIANVKLYAAQFDARYNFPYVSAPTKTLLICSTPRCGSHALGHVLLETGLLGAPFEYANPVNFAEWQRITGKSSVRSVFREVMTLRTSPSGVFSLKLHYDQLGLFGEFFALQGLFPGLAVVLLTRRDLLKQAVSMSLAHQTGECIAGQTGHGSAPAFNRAEIDAAARLILRHNALWEYTLLAYGIEPLRIAFEDFIADPEQTVRRIGKHVGVEIQKSVIAPVTKSQSTEINREWACEYLKNPVRGKMFASRQDYALRIYPPPSLLRRVVRKLGFKFSAG